MTTINPLIAFDYWIILSFIYLFAILLYVIFSLIIVRQIHLMTTTLLNGALDPYIKIVGFINLIFSFGVFLVGWIVLL